MCARCKMRDHIIGQHQEWVLDTLSSRLPKCRKQYKGSILCMNIAAMSEWFCDASRWKLIYTAKHPDIKVGEMVTACLGRAPTFVIVALPGSAGVVGGMTAAVWRSGESVRDEEGRTFVFFLDGAKHRAHRVRQQSRDVQVAWCDEARAELGFCGAFHVSGPGECARLCMPYSIWKVRQYKRTLCGELRMTWGRCAQVEAWWTDPD